MKNKEVGIWYGKIQYFILIQTKYYVLYPFRADLVEVVILDNLELINPA